MRFNSKKNRKICNTPDGENDEKDLDQPRYLDELVEDFLTRTRRLLIVGEIDDIMSSHICSYIQMFDVVSDPIYIYINSQGGCVSSGYAIIDQIISCQCPVYTIVRGQAHSMGAMIAAFGDKGCRYITPNSSMMLHSVVVQSPPDQIERYMEMMDFIEEDYDHKIHDLSKRLKITRYQLLRTMTDTKWMTSEKAIEIGLVDGLWTPTLENNIK